MKLVLKPHEMTTDDKGQPTGYAVFAEDAPVGLITHDGYVMSDEHFYNTAPERPLAEVLVAAFNTHDENATALTEARKVMRRVQEELMPEWRGGKAAQAMARLNEVVDIINVRIIASRKLAKGELP